MKRTVLVVLASLSVLFLLAAGVEAQAPYPPNQFHPYRGGTNCVQVADVNGNFNCSPLVTIDPVTGAFNSVLGGPISRAQTLVVAPLTASVVALANDLVIAKSTYASVAPTGPGSGDGVTFRVRPSPRVPGYCQVVAIAGNAFGALLEFPMAFLNPAYPFVASGGSTGSPLYDQYIVDLPGGPGGC